MNDSIPSSSDKTRALADNIPTQLKRLSSWMTCGGDSGKAPTDSKGVKADRHLPSNHRDFESALAECLKRGNGLGLVLPVGYSCFDCDDAFYPADDPLHPGQLKRWFKPLVARTDSYTERSLSGNGLHIFVESAVSPDGEKEALTFPDGSKLELLGPGHFVRVTGDLYEGKTREIKNHTDIVTQSLKEIREKREAQEPSTKPKTTTPPMTDEEILGKIRGAANAPKFVDLYDDGNIKTHHTGDASGADLGLMGMLAFYTQDPAQLDRLFRRSALMRPKWDEKHSRDGKTYGQMTIDKALADIRETYTPPRENGVALMPDPTEERPRGLQGRRMVGEAISAGVEPPPMLLENFLYEAKLQSWTGEAGHGKSILALWASLQVMRDNKPVLYLDEEGSVVQVSERLEAMGAEPEMLDRLFHYYQSPGLTLEDDALAALMETVKDVNPALVVFDSWVDFLALNGLSENDSVDVTRWVKLTVYPIRDAGATVLLLDHVNKENAGRGGRGSTAKLAKLDASFRLTQRREFDRDKVGEVTLKREKDRDAALPRVSKIVVGGDGTGKLQVRPDASMILPERDDELTDNDRAALAVLSVDGMGYREWMRAVGTSSSSSFDRSRDKLMRLGFVENRDRRYFQCSRAPAA